MITGCQLGSEEKPKWRDEGIQVGMMGGISAKVMSQPQEGKGVEQEGIPG